MALAAMGDQLVRRSVGLCHRLAVPHSAVAALVGVKVSRAALATSAPRPRAFATEGKKRPVCLSDREAKKLVKSGTEVPVGEDFWEHVADEKSVQMAEVYRNNTENYIGTVKYPVGVIGPLKVKGEYAKKDYIVPMATHEGALLASYDRGAKAITLGGGANVRIKARSMLRAPVFIFNNIVDAKNFHGYAKSAEVQAQLKKAIESHHREVTFMRVFQTDRKVHFSIGLDSKDAAGQNMVTYAGDVVMRYMKENYPAKIPEAYIEGGFNAGKRVSVLHSLLGKGHSVVVDCVIPRAVCEKVLHTTPYRLQRFQKMHNRTNEFMGGISCTAHVANGLAAFYIANGQDPACTAESQAAVTHFDLDFRGAQPSEATNMQECDLYASMTLNAVIVGTIGGGTNLPSFKAARGMMGIESANELAEVCAAMALSGELSFYAAMESGEFSSAHWNMTHKN